MEKKGIDIIPNKQDMELRILLKNKKLSLAIFETLMLIENHDDIDNNLLRELIISSDDRVEEILLSHKQTRINLNYQMYSIQLTPYYLKQMFHYFKRMGWVKADTLINRRDDKGKLMAINQRNVFVNHVPLYYYLNSFKYYLYKFLKHHDMIFEMQKIEGEFKQITKLLESDSSSSVEDAIRSLYSNTDSIVTTNESAIKEKKVEVTEPEEKKSVEDEADISEPTEKNPKSTTDENSTSLLENDDEDEDESELEFPSNVDVNK